MREKTCCFTGHRNIPDKDVQKITALTQKYIESLFQRGVKYFGVGGALGYDTLAAQLLFQLRETEAFRQIKIILVYPFPGFTNCWTPTQQIVYNNLLPCYDKIVCVSKFPSTGAYLRRNRHLVDCSAYCIAYCTRKSGGTAYTLHYAESNGLRIFNTANQ